MKPITPFRTLSVLRLVVTLALGGATIDGLSGPLDTWTLRNPSPTGSTLRAVAYANGLYIAVGGAGTIVTSVDATNWVPRQSGTVNGLSSIAFGGGRFVVVGDTGTVLTSSNGVVWGSFGADTGYDFTAVTYGNGEFVALGWSPYYPSNNITLTSSDGLNWAEHQLDTEDVPVGIAYGNGQFALVENNGPNSSVQISTDGVNWTGREAHADWRLNSITFGGGRFVALGDFVNNLGITGAILTQTGTASWTWSQVGPDGLQAVTYGDGQFVAISWSGMVLTSPDGETWNYTQPAALSYLYWLWSNGHGQLTYGKGLFVAVGIAGTIITSADGVTWFQQPAGTQNQLYGVTYGNRQFVAVGFDMTGMNGAISGFRKDPISLASAGVILTSADNLNWVRRQAGTTNGLTDITYGQGTFVAVGALGTILSSSDGTNWFLHQAGTSNNLYGITFGGNQFAAVGEAPIGNSGTILTSENGVTWTRLESGTTNSLYGIKYGGGRFVAVGNGGTILTSINGATWLHCQSGAAVDLSEIACGERQFVASGGTSKQGVILTSSDGTNWTTQSSGSEVAVYALSYFKGHFIAVHFNAFGDGSYYLVSSADGAAWEGWQRRLPLEPYFSPIYATAAGDGYVLAVGAYGKVLQSGGLVTLSLAQDGSHVLPTLSLEGPTGLSYTIQSSTDLVTWRDIANFTSSQPATSVLDVHPTSSDRSFYRAFSR